MPEFTPKLSASAVAIFVVLMTNRRAMTRDEIGTALGTKGPDDKALKVLTDNNLAENGPRDGQKTTYALSRTGWSRASAVMGADIKGTGAAANALLLLLKHVVRGLDTRGVSAEDFFEHGAEASPADAETLIRKAYTELVKADGDWVSLADVRDRLGGLGRAEFDRELLALVRRDRDVRLIPWDNQKALSDRERAAAVRYGGVEAHAIRIESP